MPGREYTFNKIVASIVIPMVKMGKNINARADRTGVARLIQQRLAALRGHSAGALWGRRGRSQREGSAWVCS